MSTRRVLLVLALLIPVGGLVASRAWPVEVEARTVSVEAVTVEVLGVGTLESAHEVAVSFEASGRVLDLAVDEGARVAAGDPLGTLDVADATREVTVADASEQAAAAAVARARADLDRATARAERATTERVRADALTAAGVVHASDHEAAIEAETVTRAERASAAAALVQAERLHRAAVHSRGQRAALVTDGTLRSPIDGLVVTRDVEVGQLVGPGAPAFTLATTDRLRVRAWVDEAAVGRLAVGQPARLLFRSEEGRGFAGVVERVGQEVDRQTHELLVDILVTERPERFVLGQRVDAWIAVASAESVVSVPRGWCGDTCAVVADGRAAARPVELGLVGRDRVEVRSGLAAGEQVLAPGAPLGRRVRAVTP